MRLSEAIAVVLYLRDADTINWNRDAYLKAKDIIHKEAKAVLAEEALKTR